MQFANLILSLSLSLPPSVSPPPLPSCSSSSPLFSIYATLIYSRFPFRISFSHLHVNSFVHLSLLRISSDLDNALPSLFEFCPIPVADLVVPDRHKFQSRLVEQVREDERKFQLSSLAETIRSDHDGDTEKKRLTFRYLEITKPELLDVFCTLFL